MVYNWTWSAYFLAMLTGAFVGKKKKDGVYLWILRSHTLTLLAGILLSVILYYVLMFFEREIASLAILNIIPLLGFTYFLYGLCCRSFPTRLYQKSWINWIVRFLGGLCLEVYIVQPSIISDKLNHLLPLNLVILFVAIIIGAYALRTIGRLWAQTFKDDDYNWKEIVKPF